MQKTITLTNRTRRMMILLFTLLLPSCSIECPLSQPFAFCISVKGEQATLDKLQYRVGGGPWENVSTKETRSCDGGAGWCCVLSDRAGKYEVILHSKNTSKTKLFEVTRDFCGINQATVEVNL